MDELGKRLSDGEDEVGQLLAEARRLEAWPAPQRADGWRRLESERAAAGGRGRRTSLALLAAAATASALVVAAVVARSSRPAPAAPSALRLSVGELWVEPGSALRVPPEADQPAGERRVFLDSGAVRARIDPQPPGRPFALITPHVRVVVVGTRFSVVVEPAATTVSVEEGLVRVQEGARSVLAGPGRSIRSDDAELIAPPAQPPERTDPAPEPARTDPVPEPERAGPAPEPSPSAALRDAAAPPPRLVSRALRPRAEVEACGQAASQAAQRACYLRFVADDGLAGQSAIFALGRLEHHAKDPARAIDYWSMYLGRFPQGAFAPDALRNLVGEYLSTGRQEDALAQTDVFLRRFGSDPHRSEIALVRANLLCARSRSAEGLSLYGELEGATGALREEARYSRARCLLSAGERERAEAALDQYLREYPQGRFAAEARRLLDRGGEP